MLEDIKSYNHQIDKQEKTPSQVASWVDANEIQTIFDKLKDNALFLYKKKDLGMNDLQNIQDFIILSLLGGIFIPPRRSLDYCAFKINNVDKEKDNYIDKNLMTFNTYKTAKFYHQQQLEIPKELKLILTKWVKVNPTDYLLFDSNKNGLNSVKLNQRLNKIFGGRKIAVNQMRHTYLTDKYGDTINKNKQINTDLTEMGSSGAQAKIYIKQ